MTRIIILASLLISCGARTILVTESPDPCEHVVEGLCVQLEENQRFVPMLLSIPMEYLETRTNESWPGLELPELMEHTRSELFYITDWTYDEAEYSTLYEGTIEVQYIDQCYFKYWPPINEIQHIIAEHHLNSHEVPEYESIVGPRMVQFMIDLCFYNWFLGNDH